MTHEACCRNHQSHNAMFHMPVIKVHPGLKNDLMKLFSPLQHKTDVWKQIKPWSTLALEATLANTLKQHVKTIPFNVTFSKLTLVFSYCQTQDSLTVFSWSFSSPTNEYVLRIPTNHCASGQWVSVEPKLTPNTFILAVFILYSLQRKHKSSQLSVHQSIFPLLPSWTETDLPRLQRHQLPSPERKWCWILL